MSDEIIKPIDDLAAQGAEQPQPEQAPASEASGATEAAPSGGDGAQGLELPAATDASKEQGEGAPAAEGTETPVSELEAAPAKDESAGGSAISPEPSEGPAAPLAAPSDEKLADEPSTATTTETETPAEPVGAELLGSEGEGAEPAAVDAPAQGDDKSSSEPLDESKSEPAAEAAPAEAAPVDEAKADQAPAEQEAPADEPKTVEQVTATGIPDVQPIFGGASDPSPAPDLKGQEELPHPALQGHGQGFISGTTMSTQSALPVPGDATAAAVAAQAIDKAQGVPDLPKADDAAASADQKAGSNVDAAQGDAEQAANTASDASVDAGDAPSIETPAVPTAAHAPEAFVDLNDDGSAALDDIDGSEAEVLRLELRGLANLALAIIKRLDKIGEKGAVNGHLESIQTSAQQVVSNALNIFEVEEEELSGFDSVSADIILDDLC